MPGLTQHLGTIMRGHTEGENNLILPKLSTLMTLVVVVVMCVSE